MEGSDAQAIEIR